MESDSFFPVTLLYSPSQPLGPLALGLPELVYLLKVLDISKRVEESDSFHFREVHVPVILKTLRYVSCQSPERRKSYRRYRFEPQTQFNWTQMRL